ncbi:NAD(P)H-quinone oxidoreductase subunit S, chloroplastic [Marchantia polymorpha subsp. ruderalis]|uniref:Uncharacterized protein n=2 Tax=Marchantia polymorpha TaxID=3197 RepID=A0AAF6C1E9_MARPO|nr:hypothetical protein MARPO_0067s0043 [Marchantia polymorpha]BBN18083.1 hypothetical protein Mp_7g19350 [Marchantia polymorpha subsp. ruderalis]CCI55384.1 NDH subunit NdhS [Marchantia polymorpha]|eukprot:PTQ35951.1 hypothetical protein MARPO_0067s0043 [Marchantia polymorpha]
MATAAQLLCLAGAAIAPAREGRVCGDGSWSRGEQLRFSSRNAVGREGKNRSAAHSVRAQGFDFWQVLGGRGLPGGEAGLKTEEGAKKLFANVGEKSSKSSSETGDEERDQVEGYDAFGKEMSGMVGGFPGGEKGLRQFLQAYPPPTKASKELERLKGEIGGPGLKARTVAPPLLMPGMTVVVKQPRNPYYMYTGIVQRVTDGRAGVIFEGGNWDKLVTFKITDLERTAKGPPMTNPKSAVLDSTPANSS